MTARTRNVLAWLVLAAVCPAAAGQRDAPRVYVPYQDLAAVMDPAGKAVLMDRTEFAALLAAAEATAKAADTLELGQVTSARYAAAVTGKTLAIDGEMTVTSLSDKPVSVPLTFGLVGITKLTLDGKPAPLGYDKSGQLVVILSGRGPHKMTVSASALLTDLPGGGMQFGISVPTAVAATLSLTAPGDLDVHATVPASKPIYDRQADRTTAALTLGGHSSLTVVLTGNGRQEDDRAILLGESTMSVELGRSHQVLSCLYTVQVLRRGVREMTFTLPAEWTITEVSCPSLVKWSVPGKPRDGRKTLVVRLRRPERGVQAVHIRATAPREGEAWRSPRVDLQDAAFQRGYLIADTGEELRVRGEKIRAARREARTAARSAAGVFATPSGRLYYHWGSDWSVRLDLSTVTLRRASLDRQTLAISPEQLTLSGQFQITAIGREMYDLSFELPPGTLRWDVDSVTVNGQTKGFEYRVATADKRRMLRIELASPVMPEAFANVVITLRHVPSDWDFATRGAAATAAKRTFSAPLIQPIADNISGLFAVTAGGDLEASSLEAPAGLKEVTVGRMASLGLSRDVQVAWSYEAAIAKPARLEVSRRRTRLSADSAGVLHAGVGKATGTWRLVYHVTRATTRTLQLLADASLGDAIKIDAPGRRIASKKRTRADEGVPEGYDLWVLTLDGDTIGDVAILVQYERPVTAETFAVPLVRPFGVRQASETLAVQASEELAVDIQAADATEIDAVDLPPLPVAVTRLLAAFRFQPLPAGKPAVTLRTTTHKNYAIPSAMVTRADLVTYLGADGSQRTAATLQFVNAGMQFLTFSLPEGADLWSVRIADQQAKPRRDAQGRYLVPAPRSRMPVPVRIVFAWTPDDAGSDVQLGPVRLADLKINKVHWTVTPPPGYSITSQQTQMQTQGIPEPALACREFLDRFLISGFLRLGAVTEYSGQAVRRRIDDGEALFEDARPSRAGVARHGRKDEAAGEDEEGSPDARKPDEPPALQPKTAPSPAKPKPAKKPAPTRPVVVAGKALIAGRYTLPVELTPLAGAGPTVTFTGLGQPSLAVTITADSQTTTWWWVGFALIAAAGILRITARPGRRCVFLLAVLAVSSLLAILWPGLRAPANGAFYAALALIPLYLGVGIARWMLRLVTPPIARRLAPAALLLPLLLTTAASAGGASKAPAPKPAPRTPPAVIPYEGNPTEADASTKILVPYARFAELWNRAHPDKPVDVGPKAGMISLADVQYAAVLRGKELHVVLTAEIAASGDGLVTLPMPIAGLAVQAATLDGKPASLQVGPGGMMLTLRGGKSGRLQVTMITTPKTLGRRGTVQLSLPPLPAAVMTVHLPQEDLVVEADGVSGTPTRGQVSQGVQWTVPLGSARNVTLRWLPKAGGGTIDRTLSAAVAHDVYAYHWAIRGATKMIYTFSTTDYDRFAFLLPEGVTVTSVAGANLRDHRVTGTKKVEGRTFQVVEVRLYRPAEKRYELTAIWVAPLPTLATPSRLVLPRAADVGRESGTVTLHAAGGMTLKVPEVVGGRRSSTATPEKLVVANVARPIAQYYWPYRPFAVTVQLDRLAVAPTVDVAQLVRVTPERVQLLAQATLTAKDGRIYGASFSLPDGYELLSVVGPVVGDFYEQPTPTGRRLHVNFRSGVTSTNVALVLVRNAAKLNPLDVPTVSVITPDGEPMDNQAGRLAVQVAPALSAHTDASENLRAIPPRTVARNWLDSAQMNAVQFAYRYEKPKISLRLAVTPKASKVRAEILGGLVVTTSSASYAYRLRYTIAGSPIDRVSFTLPTTYAPLVAVSSPAMRSVARTDAGAGRTRWTVSLINEVTGLLDITVNFALPVEPSTTSLPMPTITTDAPEGYRAILAVQNFSRHDLAMGDTSKLAPLPLADQRALLTEGARRSLQYALQSFETDWAMQIALTPAKEAKRIQAVVDLLALTSVIDTDGRCRYQALITLQNRSEQFLRVKAPEGLRLWSAHVAGQPVKPVADAKAPADEILIPLVKTDPGGMPYDVTLYFAGQGLTRLGRITKISPPAIGIVGVPVMRTTWTLRLPSGYRYIRPGGNVAPVAGTAEVMTIALEARLDQYKRWKSSYQDRIRKGKGTQYDGQNWTAYNDYISNELKVVERNITSERSNLRHKDYEKLTSKLSGQFSDQNAWELDIRREQQRQDELYLGNLIHVVNTNADNGGFAEWQRNSSLNHLPGFVTHAAREQKARLSVEQSEIAQELAKTEKSYDEQAASQSKRLQEEHRGKQADGKMGADALALDDFADKEGETREVLRKLAQEQKTRITRQQDQTKQQLAQLESNYAERYYGQLGGQTTLRWAVQRDAPGNQQLDMGSFTLTNGRGSGMSAPVGGIASNSGLLQQGQARRGASLGDAAAGETSLRIGQPDDRPTNQHWARTNGPAWTVTHGDPGRGAAGGLFVQNGGVMDLSGRAVTVDANGTVVVAGEIGGAGGGGSGAYGYVAGGMFSLPVDLPEGEVELHFARPGGDAEVTLWAVRTSVLDGASQSGAVGVLLLVLLIGVRMWRAWSKRITAPPIGYIIGYVAILVVLTALGGLAGIVLAVLLVAVLEVVRHRFAGRKATA